MLDRVTPVGAQDRRRLVVLVELNVVEQRYQAVLDVLAGLTATEVARRFGVARQTVHEWLRRYARDGLKGLVMGRRSRCRVRIRCRRRLRPQLWRCAAPIRGGDRSRSRPAASNDRISSAWFGTGTSACRA